jgi:hypothetical protein
MNPIHDAVRLSAYVPVDLPQSPKAQCLYRNPADPGTVWPVNWSGGPSIIKPHVNRRNADGIGRGTTIAPFPSAGGPGPLLRAIEKLPRVAIARRREHVQLKCATAEPARA